jgi:hypothetical protein
LKFPPTFCDNERFAKDGELHLGCRNLSPLNSREISGSSVPVRARVVNYLSSPALHELDVLDPIL